MYRFAIGIPTVNRYDLLKPVLEQYHGQDKNLDILVLDNGKQNIIPANNLFVHAPPRPLSVAESWNTLLDAIFYNHNKQYALILNDDIAMPKGFEKNVEFITEMLSPGMGSILFLADPQFEWSVFLISKHLYNTIGGFDENFKGAYFEDKDYEHRISRHPIICKVTTSFLNPLVYNKSMSVAKDSSLNENYQHNQDYFVKKWGGMPDTPFDKFKTPFNK